MATGLASLSSCARPVQELRRPTAGDARLPACLARCETQGADCSRRSLLGAALSASTLLALPLPQQAQAKPVESAIAEEKGAMTQTFYGLAAPPTSYGGYGGNAKEAAKYLFDYPSGWKIDTIGKNEKGMQGVDGRVRNTRIKGQAAYVVTFGRAGEDNKAFKLGDVDQTLNGFAGADYDLQDALTEASRRTSSKRQGENGQSFFDYELGGPTVTFLATITQKAGRVYALFVKSPTKNWTTDEQKLRAITQTFKTV